MSTADGEGGGDAVAPTVRERAKRTLERDPDLSPATFAGVMFRETSIAPDTATGLYADLVETGEREQAGPAGDPDGETLEDPITGHYACLKDLGMYDGLGEIPAESAGADTPLSCIGNQDFTGWYRSRPAGGGWDGEGRAFALSKEFDRIRTGDPENPDDEGLERVLYATVNYAPTPWFMDAWDRYRWTDDGREWEAGDAPTPGYDDVSAYAPFADIDLADDVKTDRPTGGVPTDTLEDALERYIDAFAELAGGREHVFALDSVGGAYLFVPPTATAPIADEFGRENRAILFDELTDRLNEWLEDVAGRVTDETGLGGVFEPDLLNNKNRLYKAPLSVHSSLDGVVTPINPDAPQYDFTPLDDVDSALIDETQAWVSAFTGDHRDAVDAIVASLWPNHYDSTGGWVSALEAWLEAHKATEEENQQRERKRPRAAEIPDDLETTDDLDVIKSKIEAIDVQEVARDLADEWDTDPGRDPPRFAAPWHKNHDSGTSCFATREKFVDLENGRRGGGALEFVALERGILQKPGDELRGNDYWRAVNALREEGYNIPYFEGAKGDHPDVLRLFTEPDTEEDKKRQLARALFADR